MVLFAYITFYIICALNIVWGIAKKKSNVLYAVAMVVIFLLMTFNYDGPDIAAYVQTYVTVGKVDSLSAAFNLNYMENGYTLLSFYAGKAGLNFFAFRIIVTLICLAMLNSAIKFFKVNPNIVIGLYMAYLFFFDTIQLRNFIIQIIILFAMRYLFRQSKWSWLKYVLCIVVAGSIHTISWLFLSLLLVKIFKKKSWYQIIFAVAAGMFIVCVLLSPVMPQIINTIGHYIKRGSSYFRYALRVNAWVVLGLHMVAMIPLMLYWKGVSNEIDRNKILMILRIEIIMGLFLPFCFINSNFNRIFRNVLILETIGLALLYKNANKRSNSKVISLIAQIILTAGWLITDLYRNIGQNIIGSIMEYNLIYGNASTDNILQYLVVICLCVLLFAVIKWVLPRRKKPIRMNG